MKKIIFIMIAAIIVNSTYGQRIYFCKSYTDSGDPISTGNTWTIGSGGGNVYVLFNNGGRTLNVSSITYYIDKLSASTGLYSPWENKYPLCDATKSWHVLDYKFTSAGDYKIKVLINSIEVASEYISIKDNGNATNTGGASKKDNYASSSVTAGTDIDLNSGYVYGLNTYFYMNAQNSARVYFKVSNGSNNLNTTKLIVDVYKMNSNSTYEFYTTLNYNVSSLNWVYFYYDFYSTGSYRVSVYTGASEFINTSYVTIYANTSGASGNTSASNSDYYSGSSISAGTDVDLSSGYVYGLGGPFYRSYSTNKVNVSFKVSNGTKSINTSKLTVDIYKMNSAGNYDFYKTIYYDLSNQYRTWVVFKNDFEAAGSFKVMVYTGNSVWINTAYITVN